MTAPVLGLLFLVGLAASGAAAYLRRGTLAGSVGAASAASFALLAAIAFLL